jgi:hypothetical protein
MKATTNNGADRSSALACLDTIRMSEHERRRANAGLRNGELIAELVLRAVAKVRAIARYIEHAAVGLASGIVAMSAKHTKH